MIGSSEYDSGQTDLLELFLVVPGCLVPIPVASASASCSCARLSRRVGGGAARRAGRLPGRRREAGRPAGQASEAGQRHQGRRVGGQGGGQQGLGGEPGTLQRRLRRSPGLQTPRKTVVGTLLFARLGTSLV